MKEYILIDRKYWKVVLHPDQYYLGRSIVISKSTHEHFSEFSLNEIKELFEVIRDFEISFIKSFNTTHFNWTCLNNDSYKEKNKDSEKTFHLHVRPRYSHPVVFGGHTFLDRNFGHHYERHTDDMVSEGLMELITKNIYSNIP
jgi:diadenosine tetraphosphate (Ap4A) HIT family hydrolase